MQCKQKKICRYAGKLNYYRLHNRPLRYLYTKILMTLSVIWHFQCLRNNVVRDAENYILTRERMDERVYSIVSYTHNRFISQQTQWLILGWKGSLSTLNVVPSFHRHTRLCLSEGQRRMKGSVLMKHKFYCWCLKLSSHSLL